jgi:DNA-binding transcriptional LysR family regulator
MEYYLRMVDVLDIRKLHMLAELDRLGTIAAVARELHLTASGISMQLAALDREVGVRLTERRGRRVALTPAGTVLARHGKDIADMLAVAAMDAHALREGTAGTYRIAAFPTAMRSFVADTSRLLSEEAQRGLHLQLTELEPQDALPALAAGEVELAVTHAYSNLPELTGPGLVAARIATEPVRLAVRDDDPAAGAGTGTGSDGRGDTDAGGPAVDLSDFARHDWIVSARRLTCHEMTQRACGAAGFEPRAVAEVTDYSAQLALVAAGCGVALIPQLGASHLPAGVSLRTLRAPVHRNIFAVVRRAGTADPGLSRLTALLADAARRAVRLAHDTR